MSAIHLSLEMPSHNLVEQRDLYHSMQTKALLGRLLAFLTGRSRSLLDLTTVVSERKIRSQHYAGVRTVLISQIKGSEGRTGDFDRGFNPIHSRTISRWLSIASARFHGATLPPVELIRFGEDYFVRDGHHRISVARAFREEYIDAEVIVLELELASAPLSALVMNPSLI